MNLYELYEATLPLAKGSMHRSRHNYGALVAVMNPRDFITLTIDQTYNEKHLRQDNVKGNYIYNPDDYNMPFLDVDLLSGKVMGHEGRHRAVWALDNGYDKMTVTIYFRMISWIVEYRNDDGKQQEEFTNKQEATEYYGE